jgi:hypothetical protein
LPSREISTTFHFPSISAAAAYRPSEFAGRDVAALTYQDHPYLSPDVNIADFPRVFEAAVVCFGPPNLESPLAIVLVNPCR